MSFRRSEPLNRIAPRPFGPLLRKLEVEIEHQSDSVHLLIRTLAGVVLVLIVGVEFDMLAQREQAARIEYGSAQFTELAFVEDLGTGARRGMFYALTLVQPCIANAPTDSLPPAGVIEMAMRQLSC